MSTLTSKPSSGSDGSAAPPASGTGERELYRGLLGIENLSREEIQWLATDASCLSGAMGEALSEMEEPGKVPVQKFMHRYVDHSCLVTHARALRGVVSVSGHSHDADSWTMERFARLLESEPENLFADEDNEDTLDQLHNCLNKLPERLKSAIQARYYKQEKVLDIGEKLGISASAVSSLLFRGRKQLETCMEGSV